MKFQFIILIFFSLQMMAQSPQKNIIKTIDDFFVAMETQDTNKLKEVMHPNCMIYSTFYTKKEEIKNEVLYRASFIDFMRRAIEKKYIYDEKLWSYDVSVEDNIATVWTEYTMLVGKNLDMVSHCGVNNFQLIRNENKKWVIAMIADTRRKKNCIEPQQPSYQKEAINLLMDNWHKAAATADEATFFGTMTADAIYLGTDASERWGRDEFKKWSKFAFDRESAWSFTPSNRKIYFSTNLKTAWFEESLATWMGECRGSGVLVKKEGKWKLKHYNLAVTIPNDLVNCFIHLVEKGVCKKKLKK